MSVLPGSIYVYHVYAGDDRGCKKAVGSPGTIVPDVCELPDVVLKN